MKSVVIRTCSVLFGAGWLAMAVPARATLVAWYPLDGNANDSAGINHGVVTNAVSATNRFGQANSAYYFNGAGHYITMPGESTRIQNSPISVSLWFQTTSSVSTLIEAGAHLRNENTVQVGYGLIIDGGRLRFSANRNSSTPFSNNLWDSKMSVPAYNNGAWHHVVAIFPASVSTRVYLYVDGVAVQLSDMGGSAQPAITTAYSVNSTRLGELTAGPSLPFVGVMDDVRIYNHLLSQSEVTALYLEGQPMVSILGTNGAAINHNETASLAKGSAFGSNAIYQVATNWFSITNAGSARLDISGVTTNGTGASVFAVIGMPPAVEAGSISNFSIVFSPTAMQAYTCLVAIANNSSPSPFNLLLSGLGGKQNQVISFPAIGAQSATGKVGLAATASSGLAVSFAVASGPASISGGTNLSFNGSGEVRLVASQGGDANWNPAPEVTNAVMVLKAPAQVSLTDLDQMYDGSEREVGVVTDPAGLAVVVTYDGATVPPVGVGSYLVVAQVTDSSYEGGVTGTLTVAKGDQSIGFPPIQSQPVNRRLGLAAVASSGLPVGFSLISGPAELNGGTNLTFTGTGLVVVVASQAGNVNWNPAPDATNVFEVVRAPGAVVRWEPAPGPPDYRYRSASGVLGTNLYLVAGWGSAGIVSNVFSYDGQHWNMVAGLPVSVVSLGAAVLHDKLYAVGGRNESAAISGVYEFDGASWTAASSFPHLSRAEVACATLGSSMYMIGGTHASTPERGIYRFDGTNWSFVLNMDSGVYGAGACTLGPYIYIIGGYKSAGVSREVLRFDGANIVPVADLPAPRSFMGVTTRDDKLYVIGGMDGSAGCTNVYVFDGTDWSEMSGISRPMYFNTASTLDDVMYSIGGYYGNQIGLGTSAWRSVSLPPVGSYALSASAGPMAGGNIITISGDYLGNALNITNVLIGGIASAITDLGSSWVSVLCPANNPGIQSIVIQGTSQNLLLPDIYTYRPAGWIGIHPSSFTSTWQEVKGLPDYTLRTDTLCGSLEQSLYVFGGLNESTGAIITNAYRFDGVNWNNIPAPPKHLYKPAVATFQERLHVLGGEDRLYRQAQTNVYAYDGSTWEEVRGLPKRPFELKAGVDGAHLYSIGGYYSLGIYNSITNVYRFDGASWAEVAGLPRYVVNFAAGELNDDLYLIGGFDAPNVVTNVYRFSGDAWIPIAGLPAPRQNLASAKSGRHLIVLGGNTNVYCFDGTSWVEIAPLPVICAGAASIGDDVYAVRATSTNVYRYTMPKFTGGVSPEACSTTGGVLVTISGLNLCGSLDGDVELVTLCGVTAAVVSVASPTQLVVRAAASSSPGVSGDVVVVSGEYGTTTRSNIFTYGGDVIKIIGTNGVAFKSGKSPEPALGTDFGPAAWGGGRTNRLAITNGMGFSVAITGASLVGAGGAHFSVIGLPATLAPGSSAYFDLVFNPHSAGIHDAVVEISYSEYPLPFQLPVRGTATPRSQAIEFPSIGIQSATNRTGLSAVASSGLAVTFFAQSGPAVINGGTNLSFTGTGVVAVIASQAGDADWYPAPEVTNTFSVTKVVATVLLGALNQTYNGSPRVVTVATVPAGLTVNLTYNGSANPPTNAGSYSITGTVMEVMYEGSTNGTLSVSKADQSISFPAIGDQVVTNRVRLGASASSGLPVTFAVVQGPGSISGGTNLQFTDSGLVAVAAFQPGNANWNAAPNVTNPCMVTKAIAQVTLAGLVQTNNGSPRVVTALTVPTGLVVNITYDGSPAAPAASGSYAVTGVVADVLYMGGATGTLWVIDGQPLVNITNQDVMVGHAVSSISIGGTANSFVAGLLTWTNTLAGVGGAQPAQSTWSIAGISLAEGANAIVVSGTNVQGVFSMDTVIVTRVALPMIDITNTPEVVRYSVATYQVGGISAQLAGGIHWSNWLNGASGMIPAASPFAIPGVALAVGSNTIAVTGTNLYGDAASDQIVITRGGIGTDLPMVNITNQSGTVAFETGSVTVGGTNSAHVVGHLAWTNTTGGGGMLPASGSWQIPDVALAFGTNEISVSGTNLWGETSGDTIVVVRAGPGSGLPSITVTNEDPFVRYPQSVVTIGGTCGIHAAGRISWTNSLGGGGTMAVSSNWQLAVGNLKVGTNIITVSVTNLFGTTAFDQVGIERGGIGTGLPVVDVTTTPSMVANTVLTARVSGTNNLHVAGVLSWTNSLGGAGTLPTASAWQIAAVPLGVGTNTITVRGTNLMGEGSADQVNVVRSGVIERGAYFTELFSASDNDLGFMSLTFTPDGSDNFYSVCRVGGVTAFPVDPVGGHALALGDDDYRALSVTGGLQVALYGRAYTGLYVGANGYVTFGEGDEIPIEGYDNHFRLPRISLLYDDLDPGSAGAVSWKQLADRLVVSYVAVPEYGSSTRTNNLQVELFFDGVIRLTWLYVGARDGLAGISEGHGRLSNFAESDLSGHAACVQASHTLLVSASGSGIVAPTGSVVVDHSSHAGIAIAADPYHYIDQILTNGAAYPLGAGSVTNLVFWWSNVVENGHLDVVFKPSLATNGTPHWWLALHRLTNGTWNAMALSDTDQDGHAAWEEYVADTQPTNRQSVFTIRGVQAASPVQLAIPTATGRTYAVYSASSLIPSPQVWNPLGGSFTGTGNPVLIQDPAAASGRLYRVRVSVSP